MTDNITITGVVGTQPRFLQTSDGLDIASFRIASTHRRYDKETEKWIDGETNWLSITCFRTLAVNVSRSIHKGEHVIVQGALQIKDWQNGEKSGTTVQIEAAVVGHDLTWGASSLAKTANAGEG